METTLVAELTTYIWILTNLVLVLILRQSREFGLRISKFYDIGCIANLKFVKLY